LGGQFADTVIPILNETADRLRSGRRLALGEAARLSNEAVRIGGRLSNEALDRVATEVEHRPLVTLALVLGLGILIGTIASSRRAN
jgi:hypothetical protein